MREYSDSKKIEAGTQTHWGTVPVAVIARRLNKLTLGETVWFAAQRLGVTLCRISRHRCVEWTLMFTDSSTTEVVGFAKIAPRVEGVIGALATAISKSKHKEYADQELLERKLEIMKYLVKKKRRVRPSSVGKLVKKNPMEAYDELESMLHCGWVDCGFDKEGTWFYADEMPRIKHEPTTPQAVSSIDAGQELPRAG